MTQNKAKFEFEIDNETGEKIKNWFKEMEKGYPHNSKKGWHCPATKSSGGGNAVYGLGFIGALIYYISTASSFWMGCLGILKAIVWPAFLIYESLKHLGM